MVIHKEGTKLCESEEQLRERVRKIALDIRLHAEPGTMLHHLAGELLLEGLYKERLQDFEFLPA